MSRSFVALNLAEKVQTFFLCLRTYFGMALDTQFKSVLRAPCFHFSAFASLDPSGVEVAACWLASNEPTDPPIPWPKYSNARLFSSIYKIISHFQNATEIQSIRHFEAVCFVILMTIFGCMSFHLIRVMNEQKRWHMCNVFRMSS